MVRRREEGRKGKRRKKVILKGFRKNKSRSFFTFLVLFFFVWGCGQWSGGLPENVLARVNEEQITVDEFNREFKELISEPGKEAKETNLGDLKQAYLDQMIERKILVQEARRLGIKVSQEELNQAIFEIKKDYPGEGFGEKLGLKGTTLEEWKARLEEKLLAGKMIRHALYYRGEINEEEALHYYEAHLSSFQVPQKVKARQIVVASEEDALQVLNQLRGIGGEPGRLLEVAGAQGGALRLEQAGMPFQPFTVRLQHRGDFHI